MDIKLYKVKLAGGGHIWNYGNDEEKSAKALVECAARKAELDAAGWPTCEVDTDSPNYYYFTRDETQVVSRDRYVALLEAGIKLELEQVIGVNVDPAEVFQQVSERYSAGLELPVSGGNTYNNKCEVHMPGNMLATYNQVQLLEDSCTDALQNALSAGWRIIAVCPQPDSRRPDYIMGRFNPNDDFDKDSASRGR